MGTYITKAYVRFVIAPSRLEEVRDDFREMAGPLNLRDDGFEVDDPASPHGIRAVGYDFEPVPDPDLKNYWRILFTHESPHADSYDYEIAAYELESLWPGIEATGVRLGESYG